MNNFIVFGQVVGRIKKKKRKMPFLRKGCKEDLPCLAERLGEQPSPDAKIVD